MKPLSIVAALVSCVVISNSAFALSLTLVNKTGKTLHKLYFTDAGADSWGEDQLGDEVVDPGETFTLTKISKGKYDIMFVDENEAKCDVRNVDFTASETFEMTKELIGNCQKESEQDQSGDEEE